MSDYEGELAAIGSRALRTVGSAVLIMIAAVALLGGLALCGIDYSLPPQPGTGVSRQVSEAWGPGIAAAVLAGLVLLGSIGWLVWNLRAQPRAWWWLPAVVLVIGTFVVVFAVTPLFVPSF